MYPQSCKIKYLARRYITVSTARVEVECSNDGTRLLCMAYIGVLEHSLFTCLTDLNDENKFT